MGHAQPMRFHNNRPKKLIRLRWWHRLAYISRVLPRRLDELIRSLDVAPSARVLDFGCADAPYRSSFPTTVEYLSADLPGNPKATLTIDDEGCLPLDDATVDFVLSTQVLEHVADPAVYVAECFRVLKPGGQLLLSTHGIMIYHRDPVDYWRWTSEGLERQLALAGFELRPIIGIMGLAATGLQFFQDATFIHVPRIIRPLYLLLFQGVIAVCDRFTSELSKRLNSLVIVAVGHKPAVNPVQKSGSYPAS